jgi:hypothetical protein
MQHEADHRSRSSRTERSTLVKGDVIHLAALDLILWIIWARTVGIGD